MASEIFREYDIRGIFNKDLNRENVAAIGFCLGQVFLQKGARSVSVGYDARLSANELFSWLVSGLNLAKIEVFDIGILPTPVGYFSAFTKKFDANIMITGSHNPKEYNGFKITIFDDSFFGKDLQDLGQKVDEILKSGLEIKDDFKATKFDILTPYIEFLTKEFSHLFGMRCKFIADCANGTAGIVLQKLKKELNLDMEILYKEPDGNFPNHHPDPSEEENLQDLRKALKGEFELGFGFDGDSDRIAVLTKRRNIKGDELAYLYAKNMRNPRVLGEVKCSQNMYEEIDKIGKSFMGKTGHSNIKKAMKELKIDLAAEVSGHIFFKERFFGFDDAIYAMMRVLELVKNGFDLDAELDKLPVVYSTDEIKIKSDDRLKFEVISRLKSRLVSGVDFAKITKVIDIDGVRVMFENGWGLVRASNTTPVIVTRFEAKNQEFLEVLKTEFGKIISEIMQEISR